MTLFDLFVIGVLLVSSVLALLRGFTNEVLSILAWIVGALAALWLFPYVTPILRDVISPPWLASVVAAVGIFVVAYAIVAALTARWSGGLMDLHERAALLDRTLGLIFGAARGLLIVTVAYLFFAWLVPNPDDQPGWIRYAKTRPLVEDTAALLFSLAPAPGGREVAPRSPAPARETIPAPSYRETPRQEAAPAPAQATPAPANSGADTGNGPGYNPSERRGLDRLFENTTGD
ncbi:Colicin V production protein [Parvibaculum lavamentivorans DS-1]|uniref:Colicin V production protein n=1 Tax=Parvibaculum lavamentivorans (strain DS-1 / DSM 13023 / NCIMB 13966) TaxID=402881 RepID=A7HYV2_PARL1|nr:CvpA family protein [Parvibaculum lavamentivorans]ABS65085.1 Colicin V production protein [Parvibaculum lavamentivorans DS-1]